MLLGARIDKVAVAVSPAERFTSVRLRDASRTDDDVERKMLPENPPKLVNVMVEVAVVPSGIVRVSGPAEIAKSGVSSGESRDW